VGDSAKVGARENNAHEIEVPKVSSGQIKASQVCGGLSSYLARREISTRRACARRSLSRQITALRAASRRLRVAVVGGVSVGTIHGVGQAKKVLG
jgi:hypothetical protein